MKKYCLLALIVCVIGTQLHGSADTPASKAAACVEEVRKELKKADPSVSEEGVICAARATLQNRGENEAAALLVVPRYRAPFNTGHIRFGSAATLGLAGIASLFTYWYYTKPEGLSLTRMSIFSSVIFQKFWEEVRTFRFDWATWKKFSMLFGPLACATSPLTLAGYFGYRNLHTLYTVGSDIKNRFTHNWNVFSAGYDTGKIISFNEKKRD